MGDEKKILDNYEILKTLVHIDFESLPKSGQESITMLDNFFSENQQPVDIAIIIYNGVSTAHDLRYHILKNNLLSYDNLDENNIILTGEPHPNRTLLLWDTSIQTIDPITEAAKYFKKLGYPQSNIFVYLDEGYTDPNKHELMSIDELFRRE
ncbi:MAG: hypothetical protein KAS90_03470 [Candidatus Aenigmarchaeota archaeon]|nr:hypothetical protein [Candidatus Aenigmarchaeota archaeon]